MTIKFSLAAVEFEPSADYSVRTSQVIDLPCAEDKIIPFPQTPSRRKVDYPQELTLQPGYIDEAKAKTFKEASGHGVGATTGLAISALRDAFEGVAEQVEIHNIVDSGIGRRASEFFPEAA
jgi:hypothetical protein